MNRSVQSDADCARVLDNAIRLLEDARILRKARRYASCAALAVLSLEELGKFLAHEEAFITWISSRHPQKGRLTHKQKQKLEAEALIWVMGIDEIRDLVATQGYDLGLRPVGEAQSTNAHVLDIIASIDADTYAAKPEIAKHRFVIELSQGISTRSNRNASMRIRRRAVPGWSQIRELTERWPIRWFDWRSRRSIQQRLCLNDLRV